jgi:uncharacterized protein YegP (UPF0339 family)
MKFVLFEDAAGMWRWQLKAANGQIIADGGEGYSTKGNAMQAVSRIQTSCGKIGRSKIQVLTQQPKLKRVSPEAIVIAGILQELPR